MPSQDGGDDRGDLGLGDEPGTHLQDVRTPGAAQRSGVVAHQIAQERSQDDVERDRDHHDGEQRLPDHGADRESLDDEADNCHHDDRSETGEDPLHRGRCAADIAAGEVQRDDEVRRKVRAKSRQRTVGEVQHPRRLVDHDQAQGEQRIDRSEGEPAQGCVEELLEVALRRLGEDCVNRHGPPRGSPRSASPLPPDTDATLRHTALRHTGRPRVPETWPSSNRA